MRTAGDNEVAVRAFSERVGSMLRLDFYRLFHAPLLYVMVAISAIIPAMVLTMTSANEAANAQSFTNTWQVVEMVQGGNAGMDLMSMALLCNINMVFIFAAILVSIFVSHDYSSGFIKNIFASLRCTPRRLTTSCRSQLSASFLVHAWCWRMWLGPA